MKCLRESLYWLQWELILTAVIYSQDQLRGKQKLNGSREEFWRIEIKCFTCFPVFPHIYICFCMFSCLFTVFVRSYMFYTVQIFSQINVSFEVCRSEERASQDKIFNGQTYVRLRKEVLLVFPWEFLTNSLTILKGSKFRFSTWSLNVIFSTWLSSLD